MNNLMYFNLARDESHMRVISTVNRCGFQVRDFALMEQGGKDRRLMLDVRFKHATKDEPEARAEILRKLASNVSTQERTPLFA